MRRRLEGVLMLLALAAGLCAASASAAADEAPDGVAEAAAAVDLAAAERKVFSQFGEDGVVERIFEVIEPTSKFVVEFGAHDGTTASNARNLVVNHGWGAYLIEGDPKLSRKLAKAYAPHPYVTTQQAWVFPGNIEILFEEAGVPKDLDYLVIDIDSNDYYVWRAIHDFRPKVVMLEASIFFPPPQLMVVDFHPMNYWDKTEYHGASLQSFYNLAKKKGYELVHCMSYGPNCLFVDAKYFPRFGISDNAPGKMFKMWKYAPKEPVTIPKDKQFLKIDGFRIRKKYIQTR